MVGEKSIKTFLGDILALLFFFANARLSVNFLY
jgi:hypothetical protein